MPETLKTHPTPEASAPKVPELTPHTRIEDLSTGEINVILEQYEKDFETPVIEKKERKKGSADHERNYNLTQSIATGIDFLLKSSGKESVTFGSLTITKQEGRGTLAQDYKRVGAPVESAASYTITRSRRAESYTRSETANLSFANGNVSVGVHTVDKPLGFDAKLPSRRPDGWKGAVWFADGQPELPEYKNDANSEMSTKRILEWINGQVSEQVKQESERASRTKGQRILKAFGIDRTR